MPNDPDPGRQPPRSLLCVSLHDVAPQTWSDCLRVLDAVHDVADIPLSFLVVPEWRGVPANRDHAFEARLETLRQCGHELLVHGCTHVDEEPVATPWQWVRRRVYTAGEGEFSALDTAAAARRLERGAQWFSDNGWPLAGFVAPAWLMSSGAWQALDRVHAFSYTTTLHHMIVLEPRRRVPAPCVVYSNRSRLRRRISEAWGPMRAWLTDETAILRFALHPRDANDRLLRRHWQQLLRDLLALRTPITKRRALLAVGALN
jgi:predicted deacetylase